MAYQRKSLPSVCADSVYGAVRRLRRTGCHLAPFQSRTPELPRVTILDRRTTMLH